MGSLTGIHSKLFKYIEAIAKVVNLDIYVLATEEEFNKWTNQ